MTNILSQLDKWKTLSEITFSKKDKLIVVTFLNNNKDLIKTRIGDRGKEYKKK